MADRKRITERCGCVDPGCPVHIHAHCAAVATTTLYRIDMTDETGTPMCDPCSADAMETGLFEETVTDDARSYGPRGRTA